MKNASKISKPGKEKSGISGADQRRHRGAPSPTGLVRLFAMPDIEHRRREARRWLDEFDVRITNPPFSAAPGERLFETVAERMAVSKALKAKLKGRTPSCSAPLIALNSKTSRAIYGSRSPNGRCARLSGRRPASRWCGPRCERRD